MEQGKNTDGKWKAESGKPHNSGIVNPLFDGLTYNTGSCCLTSKASFVTGDDIWVGCNEGWGKPQTKRLTPRSLLYFFSYGELSFSFSSLVLQQYGFITCKPAGLFKNGVSCFMATYMAKKSARHGTCTLPLILTVKVAMCGIN